MDHKTTKKENTETQNHILSEGISRRDALKLFGLGGMATVMPVGSDAKEPKPKSDKEAHILIVGGGTAGIITTARLKKATTNAQITLIAPNETHLYQPAQVFVAAGLLTEDEMKKPNAEFVPDGIRWIKDYVVAFDPDSNKVITAKNGEVIYDFMVVATGMEYDYSAIEGMSEAVVGKYGISSVYLNNPTEGTAQGGPLTWEWFKELRSAAKKTTPEKPIRVICTQPDTPIKCGGAPQKILYLSDDYLRGNGPEGGEDLHLNAKFIFCKKGETLFGVPEYNSVLLNEITPMYQNITHQWNYVLKKINVKQKIATFEYTYQEKGEYDEDLEEYDMISKSEMIDLSYDFIHIVPPMKPSDAVANSPLSWQKGTAKGWLEVDQYTLQHRRYPNVFGVGDVVGIALGKTGGSARHHASVVEANLIALLEGREMIEKFDGYTVCPLKTEYGKIMLAEFNYDGVAPTFPIPSDPSKPRWMWWAFDLYLLEPLYWHLMLRGRM